MPASASLSCGARERGCPRVKPDLCRVELVLLDRQLNADLQILELQARLLIGQAQGAIRAQQGRPLLGLAPLVGHGDQEIVLQVGREQLLILGDLDLVLLARHRAGDRVGKARRRLRFADDQRRRIGTQRRQRGRIDLGRDDLGRQLQLGRIEDGAAKRRVEALQRIGQLFLLDDRAQDHAASAGRQAVQDIGGQAAAERHSEASDLLGNHRVGERLAIVGRDRVEQALAIAEVKQNALPAFVAGEGCHRAGERALEVVGAAGVFLFLEHLHVLGKRRRLLLGAYEAVGEGARAVLVADEPDRKLVAVVGGLGDAVGDLQGADPAGAGHRGGGRDEDHVVARAPLGGLGQGRLDLQGEERVTLDRLIAQHAVHGEAVGGLHRIDLGHGWRRGGGSLGADGGGTFALGAGRLPERVRGDDGRGGKQSQQRHESTHLGHQRTPCLES